MRQSLILLCVVFGVLACFIGYCAALIDWVQDIRSGLYQTNYREAFWETVALLAYNVLAVKFLASKVLLDFTNPTK
ncbi:hypothetical protein DYU11_02155 [Fibrisoma montanum]|uniref:DUF4386 family protein n=1 Tax=Fibrisoma montanum TaxID=2305895 RepID=A0A418MII3_9BACT|nr:hypothetical protein [Fibrisoma montanum]RIV27141.1 hypothetical protein DYU11_02155 [Fibrisoma montanum]